MTKPGKDFEDAVGTFIKALGSPAEVLFDHHVPDRDTKSPRQVDVWVRTTIGGHIPYSILISCKDHARPLHIGDIETFRSEVESTCANMGILYSAAGFSGPALAKAKALGIACCRLYRNQPSELPETVFVDWYCCISRISLTAAKPLSLPAPADMWEGLFDTVVHNRKTTILNLLNDAFQIGREQFLEGQLAKKRFPLGWESQIALTMDDGIEIPLTLRVVWKRFRAREEAVLLNGSYAYGNGSFFGSQHSPSIDTWEPPGLGWTEIIDQEDLVIERAAIVLLFPHDFAKWLRANIGQLRICWLEKDKGLGEG